jgi:hypothetical protein
MKTATKLHSETTPNHKSEEPRFFDKLYADADTAEQQAWKTHRKLVRAIEEDEAGYRGCIGLGMIINSTNADSFKTFASTDGNAKIFMPDNTIAWASIVDIPIGYFKLKHGKREVHWATVRPTSQKFGMPQLAFGTESFSFDFRSFPFDPTRVRLGKNVTDMIPSHDTLQPHQHPQLMRLFNALNWAMTSTAFTFRKTWKPQRELLAKALDRDFKPDQRLLAFGDGVYDSVARPQQWMPRAYIAFPYDLWDEVYHRATRATGSADMLPVYSQGLREAFVDAMGKNCEYVSRFAGTVSSVEKIKYRGMTVLEFQLKGDRGEHETVRFLESCMIHKGRRTRFEAGEVIAEDKYKVNLPDDWYEISHRERWDRHISRLLVGKLDHVCRLWFERCGIVLEDGFVHFPSQIASLAALSGAVSGSLYWDVTDAMEYYREDCDAIVFPTLQMRNWHELSGALPGDVMYNFTPNDRRYESYVDQVARIRNKGHKKTPRKDG